MFGCLHHFLHLNQFVLVGVHLYEVLFGLMSGSVFVSLFLFLLMLSHRASCFYKMYGEWAECIPIS
ncbi:unnamed protein product [Acanthoscelides obtectus]|uniref:Uncharacterized protein n=1 Tax=Acanthoscelides obtectus TaxID=200917 RepID=A0A9P0PRP9_ACAOB|nr:unnamed protein product [Acanthoscelides obtectus]CAK1686242.1 hypothetical protein AOBTE_LOCUS35866 [Acanthoscelides obtectus]